MRLLPFALALLPLAAAPLATAQVTLLPAAAGDLVSAHALVDPGPVGAESPDRVPPIAVSWPLEATAALALEARPFVAESREHWFNVSGAALKVGIALEVSSPGAVVRLSPVGVAARAEAANAAIAPSGLVLFNRDGQRHTAAEAFSALADEASLAAAGTTFPAGTSAFRIRTELGAGPFRLAAPAIADGTGRYLVHVLEPASQRTLALGSERPAYLVGDRLKVEVSLAENGRALPLASVLGTLRAPSGAVVPATFVNAGSGRFSAELTLPADVAAVPGALWEVEVGTRSEVSGTPVLRSARTAFAVAAPTARLTGAARADAADGGVALALNVQTAAAGRYEVRGVLYGTGAAGTPVPAAVAQSASWLESGAGALVLRVDGNVLAGTGLRGPWEFRDLCLIDQSRLGLLERRLRGVIVP